jgi:hypothetical protein
MLTSGWPFRAPAGAEPPLMAGLNNKEARLSAIEAVRHGQPHRNPNAGRQTDDPH